MDQPLLGCSIIFNRAETSPLGSGGGLKKPLRTRHALMVEDGAFSHILQFLEIINPEGHPNRITGSKLTAILLNGWILHIDGAAAVKGSLFQNNYRYSKYNDILAQDAT